MELAILLVSALAAVGGVVGGWYAWRAWRMDSERLDVSWSTTRIDEGVFRITKHGKTDARRVSVQMWTATELVQEERARLREGDQVVMTLPRRAAGELPAVTMLADALPPDLSRFGEAMAAQRDEMRETFKRAQVAVEITWRSPRGRWTVERQTTG
jgi:hypothetical protein